MIVVLKHETSKEQQNQLVEWLEQQGVKADVSEGTFQTIIGLVGDVSRIDVDMLSMLDIVQDVKRVTEPYKKANRKVHPEDTVIDIGDTKIGGGNFAVIAGPCSVESEEQIVEVARRVQAAGAHDGQKHGYPHWSRKCQRGPERHQRGDGQL